MTRGDNSYFDLEILDLEGDIAELPEDTTITFTVKPNIYDNEPLITKDISLDALTVAILPEDTQNLEYGNYVYDVQVTYADGAIDTIITPTPFILTGEVTFNYE